MNLKICTACSKPCYYTSSDEKKFISLCCRRTVRSTEVSEKEFWDAMKALDGGGVIVNKPMTQKEREFGEKLAEEIALRKPMQKAFTSIQSQPDLHDCL